MFCLFFAVALIIIGSQAQNTQIEDAKALIKAGLVTVYLNSQDAGNITVNFMTPMPDSTFNKLASPAYISNFEPENGLNFQTYCNGTESQTRLFCTVLADTKSSNNIIYITYLASDQEDFLVGSFYSYLQIPGNTLTINVANQLTLSQQSPLRSAKGAVNFLLFISGVQSMDSDFRLNIGLSQSFNSLTGVLSFQIEISQFHSKNVSILFGFVLFMPQKYIINLFNDYTFEPGNSNINKNIIFYIKQINNFTTTTNRLLQIVPNRSNNVTVINPIPKNQSESDNLTIFERKINSQNFSLKDVKVKTFTNVVKSFTLPLINKAPLALQSIDQPSGQANEFEALFSTNGMSIILNSSVADPIIYLQLNPYVDVAPLGGTRAFSLSISYKLAININTKLPVVILCSKGFQILQLVKIDSIQFTYQYKCVICSWNQYFDWSMKKCRSFPNISYAVNVVDLS